jgi:hypothetical protein
MANGNPEPDDQRLIQEEQTKKPYTKPAFRFERVFVTSALSCGKTGPTETQCLLNPKAS